MPITGPGSYVPTTEEFEQHWALADASLGVGNEIVLPGGTTQAGLTTKKDALVAKQSDVQARLNNKETGRTNLELKKAAMIDWLGRFNGQVRAFLPGSKWLGALPEVPGQSEAQGRITQPMDDANTLWQQINADPGTAAPMILLGGYDQAAFDTDLAALKAAYTTVNGSETTLKVTRAERNTLQDNLYAMLKSYRQVLPTLFAKDDALVTTLPRLSPTPGGTPDAVTLNGSWDETLVQASFNWNASTNANLASYELRTSPGPDYSAQDEMVVASIPPGTEEAFTTDGLTVEGTTASFKVYVITGTGNEKGSNAIAITRPVLP